MFFKGKAEIIGVQKGIHKSSEECLFGWPLLCLQADEVAASVRIFQILCVLIHGDLIIDALKTLLVWFCFWFPCDLVCVR